MKLKGWEFTQAAKKIRSICGVVEFQKPREVATEDRKRAFMVRLYRESRPVTEGDPVWAYLTHRCGSVGHALGDIRFHPALHHSTDGNSYPAMLAFMGWNPETKKFSGIHRTYLTLDGRKAQVDPVRMTYGELGDVRLGQGQDRIGVAEGIETALCAGHLFGIPVWAAISEGGVKVWNPPAGIRSVVVCGDNDQNYVGQAAAFDLAKRLRLKNGLDVEVQIPPIPGSDWADVWAQQNVQHEGIA
jgi:putative DNA primase/helicase